MKWSSDMVTRHPPAFACAGWRTQLNLLGQRLSARAVPGTMHFRANRTVAHRADWRCVLTCQIQLFAIARMAGERRLRAICARSLCATAPNPATVPFARYDMANSRRLR
jgi:hypothetical protein